MKKHEVECSECDGTGDSSWESPDDGQCPFCEGKGRLTEKIPVFWTTIKKIWKAAVAHFEKGKDDEQARD